MDRLHFISGLPRAGSTLLAALLRQNPRFHATMSSPVGSLFSTLHNGMGVDNENAIFLDQAAKARLLKGLFENYYQELESKEVIFDTNRIWCSKLPLLTQLFPESKVISCVRNVAWVMDSFECLYRRNAFDVPKLFNNAERETVYTRVEALANYNRLVGFAWSALKEAYYSDQADRLLLVDYDLLTQAPEKTLRLIYEFLGEPYFPHEFENLQYDEPEFDARLGTPGLHRVCGKVQFKPRRTVLPPDLFERFDKLSFWRDATASKANVIAVKAPQDTTSNLAPKSADGAAVIG